MKYYSNESIDKLVDHYLSKNGEINVIKEGCLACFGLAVLGAKGLKYAVIKEVYLNEWSSTNSVRLFNKLPKKYQN